MNLDNSAESPTAWRDLIAGGRLPRFALVCAGTWLAAADELMTATIMPTVASDIGGYAWFGWVVAIYLTGAILGGATAGRLSLRMGLRPALALAGAAYALGCVASAVSPTIFYFLLGRLLQGLGGGWISGLCYVAVSSLFPQKLWSRVLSGLAGIWGAATLFSPLIGGLFAQGGFWRGAFWLFAVQGAAFIAAAMVLVGSARPDAPEARARPPIAQLAALTAAIVAIAAAGLLPSAIQAAAAAALGLVLLALFLRLDARAKSRLLPASAADPKGAAGAGLLMIFAMTTATMGFAVYGAVLLQTLHGVRPIVAGYILGGGAMAWTITALAIAGQRRDGRFIRLGGALIALGLAGMAVVAPHGPLALTAFCVVLQGAGFGFAWSFSASRIVAGVAEPERAIASSSIPTAQMIGGAVGAAGVGAIANGLGFAHGVTVARAGEAAFWLFAAFVPLALVGAAAAWRLGSARLAAPDGVK